MSLPNLITGIQNTTSVKRMKQSPKEAKMNFSILSLIYVTA